MIHIIIYQLGYSLSHMTSYVLLASLVPPIANRDELIELHNQDRRPIYWSGLSLYGYWTLGVI